MIVMPARAGGWAVAVLVAVALAGCSPSEQPREDAGAPTATSEVPSSSAAPTTQTLSPAEREALDRAAAEQAWVDYWSARVNVATNYPQIPESQWYSLVSQYAVDEIASQDVIGFADLQSQGLVGYGHVVHRLSWEEGIAGEDTAYLWDCQDNSQSGALDAETGEKQTVGGPRTSVRGTLVRGKAGQWLVQQLEYYVDREC